MVPRGVRWLVILAPVMVLASMSPAAVKAQQWVTSPEQFFGHPIGADYVLPDYQAFAGYMQRLATESERVSLVEIGRTAEDRPQYMAIVTAPANHRDLERYREISQKLALGRDLLGRDLSDEQARVLARDGKAIVWIDGGLHATEVLGPQQLIETVYHLASNDDAETRRILDEVIVLAVHANPDGMDLVSGWYMRHDEPMRRTFQDIPRLYQRYIGHDNNRDFYMSTQPESENMNRVLYHEWHPQIMYNHHQTGANGQVMFAPPFREPYNQVVHGLVRTGIELVGAAMHTRFIAEDKPGVGTREGAGYSTWWNGGLRSTVYFHNMIGLLTETKGSPSPHRNDVRNDIPLIPHLQLPTSVMPFPIEPQPWRFRQSVDYSVTANYAVLDAAARYRETFLFNRYKMARDAIEKGSRDSWTVYPQRVQALTAIMDSAQQDSDDYTFSASCARIRTGMPRSFQRPCMPATEGAPYLARTLRAPELRDPRGYVLRADQADFPTAVKFINALRENGVEVHRASAGFDVQGKRYPAGSLVVKTAQAFRPHILDMFEPQDHPNDFEYPGGPPIHPYDAAGWTLAYQMGIEFDRILDDFDGPFEIVSEWNLAPPPATAPAAVAGYILSPGQNDSFRAVSRLLSAGERVERLTGAGQADGVAWEAGAFYVPASASADRRMSALAAELGIGVQAAQAEPRASRLPLQQPRIGLWDEYGGSMRSGWTRWILEQFEIPFQLVFARELDTGDLRQKYDVLVFVDGAIPASDRLRGGQPDASEIPVEYHAMLGHVSVAQTVPQLAAFLEAGGTVITIGSSTVLALHLGLPLRDKLVTRDDTGALQPLDGAEFFVPASILEARVDPAHPVAAGLGERAYVTFDNSPVFALEPEAAEQGVRAIAWFDTATPLRSGWAWGQHHLLNGVIAAEARVGRGSLLLFGPEILYRGQAHGTFGVFFNALFGPVHTEGEF